MALALQGQIIPVRNAGVGGNTTAQMLARFSTDVLAYSFDHLHIFAGTNDTDPEAQTRPNITAMIQLAQAAGKTVSLSTIPPAYTSGLLTPAPVAAAKSGGTLGAGTYSYRVSALNALGETLASTAVTATCDGSTTTAVQISWPAINGATGYRVYGRTSGSELRIVTNGGNSLSGQARAPCFYVDTGAATPSGALPASNTTPTSSTSEAVTVKIAGVNKVIRELAVQYGLPLVDFYTLCTDPATGAWRQGWDVDGAHTSPFASRKMGELAAETFGPLFNLLPPPLPWQNAPGAPGDIYSNCLFGSNNGTIPTNFGPWNGTAIESMIIGPGVVKRYKKTQIYYPSRFDTLGFVTNFTSGHKYALVFRLKITGSDAGGGQVAIAIQSGSARFAHLVLNSDTPYSDGCVVYLEGVAPSTGTATMAFNIAYGTLTAELSQLRVIDLGLA
jgi:lysophospholipase L1-like esterase